MKYVEFTAEDFELALAEDKKDMRINSILSLMVLAGISFIFFMLV